MTGAVAVPISLASTFAQVSPGVPSVRYGTWKRCMGTAVAVAWLLQAANNGRNGATLAVATLLSSLPHALRGTGPELPPELLQGLRVLPHGQPDACCLREGVAGARVRDTRKLLLLMPTPSWPALLLGCARACFILNVVVLNVWGRVFVSQCVASAESGKHGT